jgi:DNA polymerase-2
VYQERGERIKGGFVMQSKSGIYDYILVLDFKSLYPSIIRTFNIDPLAFSPDGEIEAPNGARFRNNEGILPMLIQSLWEARDKAKREKNDMKSFAIKITMNSFFGVLANPNCRFYSIEMANAITHFARKIVQDTAEKVKELGYEVIYGDTDSVFVKSGSENYEDAAKIGKRISKEINDHFNGLVKKEYRRKSFLELEFEKVFKKFLMPRIRGSNVGAKKRYAGLDVDEQGKEKIKITGLEFVRSDWTEIAKEFQMGLLERLFHDKDVKKYIKRVVEEIMAGKHDEKLVYRKSLTKKLEAYTKTTPPHVKAARLLPKVTDRIIRYYQTADGPQPIQNVTAKIDYDHYIEKQIKPIADSILEFKGLKFDELIEGENQKSIFDY